MAELRVSHLFIGLIVLVIIATPILIFVGLVAIPSFDILGWRTPAVDQKKLTEVVDKGLATASGYTAAKTPTEAMSQFRDAIHGRKYKYAANYCSKDYADMLVRAHTAASEMGDSLDRIREFGKTNGLMTDKLTFALYNLDPFPKNFNTDKPPEVKGDKAVGQFKWDVPQLKTPTLVLFQEVSQNFDKEMYQNNLGPPVIFTKQIELVKEGEEWKLNIPTNEVWKTAVAYYIDHYKTHQTGLDSFVKNMNNERYDSPAAFENGVFAKLKAAKQ